MRKEDKSQLIQSLTQELLNAKHLYITDISNMNVANTNKLRRLCFKREVKLVVVKNTLLHKAMEQSGKDFGTLYDVLKGHTSIMISEQGNVPAKLIKEFRKTSEKPLLKGAYVEEMTFLGEKELDTLIAIKTKNELIADVLLMLNSPMRNVIAALQSGGQKISGVLKTLSERPS